MLHGEVSPSAATHVAEIFLLSLGFVLARRSDRFIVKCSEFFLLSVLFAFRDSQGDPRHGKYMACCMMYRGDVMDGEGCVIFVSSIKSALCISYHILHFVLRRRFASAFCFLRFAFCSSALDMHCTSITATYARVPYSRLGKSTSSTDREEPLIAPVLSPLFPEVVPKDVNAAVATIKTKRTIQFVDW